MGGDGRHYGHGRGPAYGHSVPASPIVEMPPSPAPGHHANNMMFVEFPDDDDDDEDAEYDDDDCVRTHTYAEDVDNANIVHEVRTASKNHKNQTPQTTLYTLYMQLPNTFSTLSLCHSLSLLRMQRVHTFSTIYVWLQLQHDQHAHKKPHLNAPCARVYLVSLSVFALAPRMCSVSVYATRVSLLVGAIKAHFCVAIFFVFGKRCGRFICFAVRILFSLCLCFAYVFYFYYRTLLCILPYHFGLRHFAFRIERGGSNTGRWIIYR